jgi:hypothetical protein
VSDGVGHPQLAHALAQARAADLRRAAEAHVPACSQPRRRLADSQPTVTLRIACPDDAQVLAWLAELDEAPRLEGPVLIAEVGGCARAAVSLSDFRTIANPYEPTEALVQLLMVRVRQLHAPERPRRLRLARLRALFSV